ncbi:hypothetical protein [Streptomyces sp. NPDC101455]|uniref:hypothetical protein n=1 Tax=Streptomyces sp. NPDC101455 TaxID=3366142 RepID=UPI0038263E23
MGRGPWRGGRFRGGGGGTAGPFTVPGRYGRGLFQVDALTGDSWGHGTAVPYDGLSRPEGKAVWFDLPGTAT